ncbi:MAG: hypothetical protein H6817_07560 [Phycisphaerales bacterium]|nr:hypothetical protein [Phycisphaerales bacterium]
MNQTRRRRHYRIWIDPLAQTSAGWFKMSRRSSLLLGVILLVVGVYHFISCLLGARFAGVFGEFVALLIAGIGVVCLVGATRATREKTMRTNVRVSRRDERLARIVGMDGATRRVPHRLLEHALRHDWGVRASKRFHRFLGAFLRKLPAGDTVVIDGPRGCDVVLPVATEQSFEPVEYGHDVYDSIISELCFAAQHRDPQCYMIDMERGGYIKAETQTESRTDKRAGVLDFVFSRVLGLVFAIVCVISCVGGLVFVVGKMLYLAAAGNPVAAAATLALACLVFGPVLYRKLVMGRGAYLVPGGIVLTEQRFWRERGSMHYFCAVTTPMIIDWIGQSAYVLRSDGIQVVPANWTLLAAWMSNARSPSEAELESLIDQK